MGPVFVVFQTMNKEIPMRVYRLIQTGPKSQRGVKKRAYLMSHTRLEWPGR